MTRTWRTTASPLDSQEPPPRTLVEEAYRRLREDIIAWKYPPGSRLRVEHIKDDYGVGAGTLREALSLLVADTLVVAEGQRGFSVALISLDDLEDLTRVRILLESEALRWSLRRVDDAWEADLVSAFYRLSKVEEKLKSRPDELGSWDACNKRFHEALIAAADSRWLDHLTGILYRQSERYRRIAIAKNPIKRDVHAEHAEIFEAALKRDEERAVACLTRHVQLTCDAIRHQLSVEAAEGEGAERVEGARVDRRRARAT